MRKPWRSPKPDIAYVVEVTCYKHQPARKAEEIVSSVVAAQKLLSKNLGAGTRCVVVYPTRKAVTAKSAEMAQAAIEVALMAFPKQQQA